MSVCLTTRHRQPTVPHRAGGDRDDKVSTRPQPLPAQVKTDVNNAGGAGSGGGWGSLHLTPASFRQRNGEGEEDDLVIKQ